MSEPQRGQNKWLEVERCVSAFETALRANGGAELAAFVPPSDHPWRDSILCELIRVDLEARWTAAAPIDLASYQEQFPEVFADPRWQGLLQFELDRQRREHGHASALGSAVDAGEVGVAPPWPRVGESLLGFDLLEELGRGAFSRVFLARQRDLGRRLVALKVANLPLGEPQRLAQLQHTHIVPIHSVHAANGMQVFCMPFFGRTTLADVIRRQPSLPADGGPIVALLRENGSVARPTGSVELGLDRLSHTAYVDVVLDWARSLAEGLEHAHARGILHLDLKPANVLITDWGAPMLLDFNLAQDAGPARRLETVGGTPAYMSPEQLRLVRGARGSLDARTDIFSLGLVLRELLGGAPATWPPGSSLHEAIDALVALRADPAVAAPLPAAVSPAVCSILRKCLESEPDRRYHSAGQLREDLDRQLNDLPLRHAPEAALRERATKWRRRHPRLASGTAVALISLLLVGCLMGLLASWNQRLRQARQEVATSAAKDRFRGFLADKDTAAVLMLLPAPDVDAAAQGRRLARELVREYAVLDTADWDRRGAPALLAGGDRERLRREMGELLFLLARVESHPLGKKDAGWQDRDFAPLTLNAAAARCFAGVEVPTAIARQRRLLEGPAAAEIEPAPSSPETPRVEALDSFLAASEEYQAARYADAVESSQDSLARDPTRYSAWFLLGNAHYHRAAHNLAEHSYSTCVSLRPDFPWAYFARGLSRLQQGRAEASREDFSRVLELEPTLIAAYVNRALALERGGRFAEALVDLDEALERGAPPARIYLLRSRVHMQSGNPTAARAEGARGLNSTPTDETSWVARGYARMSNDPQGALADFDAALELRADSREALQNRAHVLAEMLGRPEEGIATLNRLLQDDPAYLPALGGRGVLQARLGRRGPALQDARACLRADNSPFTLYQVAGIYAQTSRQHSEDREEAIRLLALALHRDPQLLSLLGDDDDLRPLADSEAFARIVASARELERHQLALQPVLSQLP